MSRLHREIVCRWIYWSVFALARRNKRDVESAHRAAQTASLSLRVKR